MENIVKVLESGSSEEKIKILETLDKTDNPEILEKIISKLDDDDIKVRGEAFSSLVLNKNKISNFLIQNLNSTSKNVRGFAALALANRNETSAIPKIAKLAKDERSMVRSCAIGALSHLKAKEEREIFLDSVLDTNMEVRKSALQAIINLKFPISEEKIKEISKDADSELLKMLSKLKKK
ncbi:Epoxyqueuosine reductase protein [Marine Group I thaumarchaeote SCGC AAA799-E16]|uniref:Epoxyqueuosine reductase protein n=4 Tax=Marine Group I TaxID=905826 RepID=A0A087S768_9ARCH|nr:Epoxyqueuosine reductase protein [Marine Group I thaumarchaeote SCGC AAA799-E16]KFM17327.1 Epoxyqueuosine reductase protein [Marine Group I thaumarchaeote SCGC AAA799-D11]KFM19348.1 Epoxyqueuosine reductase protein [Marine Group I thaumarchaeote SCGC RSA3]KFM21572.1 Epoxyqueuosine reductase protein [Marine Group I thaumarchaeote SCGC AAA799-B03]